jgi:hypothetical protein
MDNTAMDILEGKCDLKEVPIEHRSYAVYLAQLAKCGYDINWIPEESRTEELYVVSVRCSPTVSVIRWIPSKHLTYNVCFESVKRFGDNLQYVPEKYRDTEMCQMAIKNRAEVLQFVPPEVLTVEFCKNAANVGCKLTHIPDQFKEEVYAYACSCNVNGVFQIPRKERTKEHYLLAYKKGLDFEDIPVEMRIDMSV